MICLNVFKRPLIGWFAVNNIYNSVAQSAQSEMFAGSTVSCTTPIHILSLSPTYSPDGKILIHPQPGQCMCTRNMQMYTQWHQTLSIRQRILLKNIKWMWIHTSSTYKLLQYNASHTFGLKEVYPKIRSSFIHPQIFKKKSGFVIYFLL